MSLLLQPLADAAEFHDRKTPVGTKLRSREIETLPRELRNAAQMSAGVESARVLGTVQKKVSAMLNHRRDSLGGLPDRSGFIRDLSKIGEEEGLTPQDETKRGTIEDITSEARLGLIYEMQTGMAYGYANWKAGVDPDGLEAFPAQELVRIKEAKVPRNWEVRWASAGQEVGWVGAAKQPHVALKSSPIWAKLSRFGNPWPPYDFNSGMWVEDVGLEDAMRLGLIKPGQKIEPPKESFTDQLSGSVKGVSPELRGELQREFGDKIVIEGDEVRWVEPPKPKPSNETDEAGGGEKKPDLNPMAEPKRFETPEEGSKWADEYINPFRQGFSAGDIEVLKQAQSDTRPVNDPLWTGEKMTPKAKEYARRLSQAIRKGPELPNIELWHYSDAKWWGEYKLGSTVTLQGFTSTTLAKNPQVEAEFGKGAIIKLRISAGVRAVYQDRIRGNPKYDYQAEVLLDAGTKVVIQSKVKKVGVWYIVADVLML